MKKPINEKKLETVVNILAQRKNVLTRCQQKESINCMKQYRLNDRLIYKSDCVQSDDEMSMRCVCQMIRTRD